MITEKEIRKLFYKAHLRKLLGQMLKEKYYPYVNRKPSETPVPWYELRPGWTVDKIVECVRFKELVRSETNRFTALYAEYYDVVHKTGERKWFRTDKLHMRTVEGTDPQAYEVIPYMNPRRRPDNEVIDSWIKSHLLDSDRWIKNNTAVDIVLPGFGMKK